MCRYVLDHHPKIKDSWEYLEREVIWERLTLQGTVTYKHVAFGKVLSQRSVPMTHGPDYVQMDAYGPGLPRNTFPDAGYVNYDAPYIPGMWALNAQTGFIYKAQAAFYTVNPDAGQPRFSQPWFLSHAPGGGAATVRAREHIISGTEIDSIGKYIPTTSTLSPTAEHCCGFGRMTAKTYYVGNISRWLYGGVESYPIIAQRSATPGSETRTIYQPVRWAVHRPTEKDGDVPYIAIGRKAYMASAPLDAYDAIRYDNSSPPRRWYLIYHSFSDPSGNVNDTADLPFGQETVSANSNAVLGKEAWLFWRKPCGDARDGYDGEEFTYHSNILTEKQLNGLLKLKAPFDVPGEPEHMHFELAIL
jgi:hypothetical protein